MLSKKSMGIAGAAMLGTAALLGTNAAQAIKVDGGDDPVDVRKGDRARRWKRWTWTVPSTTC